MNTLALISPVVTIVDGQVTTTSKSIAEYFIAREKEALEAADQIVLPSHTETLIPSEQQTLSEIVHKKAAPYGEHIGKALAEIWSRLHRKFRVAKYSQLPRTQLSDAIVYVTGLTLRSVSAQATPLPGLTPEQQASVNRQLDSLTSLWVFDSAAKGWAFNHLRVVFQVARWQDIPSAQFPAVQALIDSKYEATGQFCGFIMEARDWFEKNVMGGSEPWTPALKRKLAKELPKSVNRLPGARRPPPGAHQRRDGGAPRAVEEGVGFFDLLRRPDKLRGPAPGGQSHFGEHARGGRCG